MAATNLNSRIQDIIGEDMDATLVPGYGDLVADAFNYIADLIPPDSELWTISDDDTTAVNYKEFVSTAPKSSDLNLGTVKLLFAEAKYTGDDSFIPCLQIKYTEYLKGLNPNSIYTHGGSYYSPVFTSDHKGLLLVSPGLEDEPNGTLRVYYFDYLTGATDFEVATISGFPTKANYAACLKSAHNLIMGRMSDATQDDEDLELVQLLQAQSQSIENRLQWETTRLVGGKVMGEKE